MAELKTQKNDGDVDAFLGAVEDPARRADAQAVCALLTKVSGERPAMWGDAIVGFGDTTLVYPNGRELDWMVLGFSPRKGSTTIYLNGAADDYADMLARLGKHKAKGGCLHITRMSDVDEGVLEELLAESWARGSA